ncbi:MAG: cytochrome [Mycobacterium sp.]|jgi:cytochrome P450|nr:cytochrome [Mycobacterium sp.]
MNCANQSDRLTEFDHNDSSVSAADMRQAYTDMREQCPVAHSERFGGFDYVSRYADVREILSKSDTFTSGEGVFIPDTGVPRVPPLEFDPPAHTTLRKMMDGPINPRTVRDFEPTIIEIANGLVDEFAARGTADLAVDLAEPLPAIVIGRMVGLDKDESVEVRRIAIELFESIGTPEFEAKMQGFAAFNEAQLEVRRRQPRNDYLTDIATGELNGVPVDAERVTGIMTAYLLGGHHSTATGIGGLLRYVLTVPGLRDRLVDNDDKALLHRVIEESLRLTTPLQFFARTVHGDSTVGDVQFSENQRIVMNLAAANRDPRQFDEPECFNPDRSRNAHVAFGGGLHSCQGQHIARAEMRAVLQVLLTRLPDVHLVGDVGETGVTAGLMAVTSLPVAFTPEQSRT